MEENKVKCDFLNKEFGKGYYICTFLLRPVSEEYCKVFCKYKEGK